MSNLDHLQAIVAVWLTNGQQPVDGANDPRQFTAVGWADAQKATEGLVDWGFLAWAHPDLVAVDPDHQVIPTSKGVFAALNTTGRHEHPDPDELP